MTNLDNYRPWESHLCGNDLHALERAHTRCRAVASNPRMPWFERERAWELLSSGSITEYEAIRVAWVELVEAMQPAHPNV